MPSEPADAEALGNVAKSVARARALLITANVENLTHCENELSSAIASLEAFRRDPQPLGSEAAETARSAVQQVQREVSEFSGLLRQAREFHAGWSGLSEANLAGYTASGAPAPLDRDHSRIAMKG